MKKLITPMRAADLKGDITLLAGRFPLYLSPKFDGYRATTQPHAAPGFAPGISVWSKNNKLVPNDFIQQALDHWTFTKLDGELVVGDPTAPGSLQATSSGVTTRKGEPDFTFWVFDDLTRLDLPFKDRLRMVQQRAQKLGAFSRVRAVPHKLVKTMEEAVAYEAECVAKGYEGVMVRHPDGMYKQEGTEPRSTVKELYVAKLKRKDHFEARVLSVYEQMENTNEATRDEIGRTKRSTAKAGKRGKGVLGGCVVQGISGRWKGVQFDVGTGFSDDQRDELWSAHMAYLGGQIPVRDGKEQPPVVGRIMKCESGITPATFKKPQFPRFADWKWEGDL